LPNVRFTGSGRVGAPDGYDLLCRLPAFIFVRARKLMGIYRMIGEEELWRWMTTAPREPTEGPSGGICTSLDEAKATFPGGVLVSISVMNLYPLVSPAHCSASSELIP
jgi:hypothetical protein